MTRPSGMISRLTKVVKGQDLVEKQRSAVEIERLAAAHAELTTQYDMLKHLAEALATERDGNARQRDALAAQVEALNLQLGAITAQRDATNALFEAVNKHFGAVTAQRDEFMSQRDEMIVQRESYIAQLANLESRCEEFTAEREQLSRQNNGYIAQIASLSNVAVERDRMARQLATAADSSGVGAAQMESRLSRARAQYLDLTESTLIGAIYEDPPLPTFGNTQFSHELRDRGLDWPTTAYSMIGAARMRNFRVLLERVIIGAIPGDIVETGVWRGGASILARAVLNAYEATDRRVILADSFEGLPPPDLAHYPADQGSTYHEYPELAVSLEQVQSNFKRFGLLDENVVFCKGWFKDTMPVLPTKQIAILRLDGDMYESTIDPLNYLYDRVSPGGWIIVDDYAWIPACKAAVTDFLGARGLNPEIIPIDGVGVYFQKSP